MQERRRIKLIKEDFQYRFMLKTVLVVVITLNTTLFAVYLLDKLYGLPGSMFNMFSLSLLLMEAAAVAIVFWIGRDISFHIAGPVYAMERTLKSMADGNVSQRVALRGGDNFNETADTLNTVLETYQGRIAKIQKLLAEGTTLSTATQRELRQELEWFKTSEEQAATATVAKLTPRANAATARIGA